MRATLQSFARTRHIQTNKPVNHTDNSWNRDDGGTVTSLRRRLLATRSASLTKVPFLRNIDDGPPRIYTNYAKGFATSIALSLALESISNAVAGYGGFAWTLILATLVTTVGAIGVGGGFKVRSGCKTNQSVYLFTHKHQASCRTRRRATNARNQRRLSRRREKARKRSDEDRCRIFPVGGEAGRDRTVARVHDRERGVPRVPADS